MMLSLQRRADGKTAVDVKVAPFALPQNLKLVRRRSVCPNRITSSFGGTGSRIPSTASSRAHGG